MAAVVPDSRRAGAWFALLVPGVLAAISLPISALVAQPSNTGVFGEIGGASLMKALYLGDVPPGWPTGFPLGWCGTAALAACVLLTAAWYRRPKVPGQPISLRGYLVTGTVLVAVTAGLPLAGWASPIDSGSLASRWLNVLWQQGTFAQLAIAVTLVVIARALRSRALMVIAAGYAALVSWAGWTEFQLAPLGFPLTDPYVVSAMLLPAGLVVLLAAALRSRVRGVTSGPSAT
jgi:hypothetical protein